MTVQTINATRHVAGDVTTPDNAVGVVNATWTGNVDNENWISRWELEKVDGALTGEQTVTIRVRKQEGTGTPTFTVALYEDDVLTKIVAADLTVTSLTGQDQIVRFTPNDAEAVISLEIDCAAVSGSPSGRASVQVDAFTSNAVFDSFLGSSIQSWSGTGWVLGKLKRWDGAAWLPQRVQRWSGSGWVNVP